MKKIQNRKQAVLLIFLTLNFAAMFLNLEFKDQSYSTLDSEMILSEKNDQIIISHLKPVRSSGPDRFTSLEFFHNFIGYEPNR